MNIVRKIVFHTPAHYFPYTKKELPIFHRINSSSVSSVYYVLFSSLYSSLVYNICFSNFFIFCLIPFLHSGHFTFFQVIGIIYIRIVNCSCIIFYNIFKIDKICPMCSKICGANLFYTKTAP